MRPRQTERVSGLAEFGVRVDDPEPTRAVLQGYVDRLSRRTDLVLGEPV
ncbi:hypothetical protein [Nocardia thraciensis]